jgi:hypothetical protein
MSRITILADRKVVEVNGFARTSGGAIAFFRECRIFDAKGQLIDSGMKGALKGRIKPSGQSKAGMIGDTGNVIKMENDLVMLPVTITYEAIKMK